MGSTVGRLYFYTVSFVALLAAVYGAGSLLSTLGRLGLEPGTAVAGEVPFWRTALSTYIPLLAVAGAVWAGHWLALARRMRAQPAEQQATLRRLFLILVLGVAAGAVLFNGTRFVYHLLSALTGEALPPFPGRGRPHDVFNAAVWLLAYGSVWYYHWRVETGEGRATETGRTLRRWYVYLLSLASLGLLVAGVYYNLSLLLSRVIGVPAVQVLGDDLGRTIAVWILTFAPILSGGGWWIFHWRYAAGQDQAGVLRRVFLYLWILLGVVGTAVAAGIAEYQGLRFLFGYRDISPSAQLRFVTYALPLLLVSAAAWAYHRRVAREEAAQAVRDPAVVERRYGYLVSAAGLALLALGLALLVQTLLEVALQTGQEIGGEPQWWRDRLSAAAAMAVTGSAVWLPHWLAVERSAQAGGPQEAWALSRRFYLYAVLLVGMIAVLFNSAFFLNYLLRLALGEPAAAAFLSDLFAGFGNAAIAGLFVLYHWRVLLRDREATRGLPRPVVRRMVLLYRPEAEPRALQLREVLGAQVTLAREADESIVLLSDGTPGLLSEADLAALLERVRAAPGEEVILVLKESAIEVHST